METPRASPGLSRRACVPGVGQGRRSPGREGAAPGKRADEWELPGGKLELREEPARLRSPRDPRGNRLASHRPGRCWIAGSTISAPAADVVIVTYGCHVLQHRSASVISNEHKRAALFTLRPSAGTWSCLTAISSSVATWFARLGNGLAAVPAREDPGDDRTLRSVRVTRLRRRVLRHPAPLARYLRPAVRGGRADRRGVLAARRRVASSPVGNLGAILLRLPARRRADPAASGRSGGLRPDLHFHDRDAAVVASPISRTLTHIARTLAIPPHILGIVGP